MEASYEPSPNMPKVSRVKTRVEGFNLLITDRQTRREKMATISQIKGELNGVPLKIDLVWQI